MIFDADRCRVFSTRAYELPVYWIFPLKSNCAFGRPPIIHRKIRPSRVFGVEESDVKVLR